MSKGQFLLVLRRAKKSLEDGRVYGLRLVVKGCTHFASLGGKDEVAGSMGV